MPRVWLNEPNQVKASQVKGNRIHKTNQNTQSMWSTLLQVELPAFFPRTVNDALDAGANIQHSYANGITPFLGSLVKTTLEPLDVTLETPMRYPNWPCEASFGALVTVCFDFPCAFLVSCTLSCWDVGFPVSAGHVSLQAVLHEKLDVVPCSKLDDRFEVRMISNDILYFFSSFDDGLTTARWNSWCKDLRTRWPEPPMSASRDLSDSQCRSRRSRRCRSFQVVAHWPCTCAESTGTSRFTGRIRWTKHETWWSMMKHDETQLQSQH